MGITTTQTRDRLHELLLIFIFEGEMNRFFHKDHILSKVLKSSLQAEKPLEKPTLKAHVGFSAALL